MQFDSVGPWESQPQTESQSAHPASAIAELKKSRAPSKRHPDTEHRDKRLSEKENAVAETPAAHSTGTASSEQSPLGEQAAADEHSNVGHLTNAREAMSAWIRREWRPSQEPFAESEAGQSQEGSKRSGLTAHSPSDEWQSSSGLDRRSAEVPLQQDFSAAQHPFDGPKLLAASGAPKLWSRRHEVKQPHTHAVGDSDTHPADHEISEAADSTKQGILPEASNFQERGIHANQENVLESMHSQAQKSIGEERQQSDVLIQASINTRAVPPLIFIKKLVNKIDEKLGSSSDDSSSISSSDSDSDQSESSSRASKPHFPNSFGFNNIFRHSKAGSKSSLNSSAFDDESSSAPSSSLRRTSSSIQAVEPRPGTAFGRTTSSITGKPQTQAVLSTAEETPEAEGSGRLLSTAGRSHQSSSSSKARSSSSASFASAIGPPPKAQDSAPRPTLQDAEPPRCLMSEGTGSEADFPNILSKPPVTSEADSKPAKSSQDVRPNSGHARTGSKSHHELYLQTLAEARKGPKPCRPALPVNTNIAEERAKVRMREQMKVPVASWSVQQVCDWVGALGLAQYRKRFIHQGISGALLLKLNHSLLKTELGIGVLGHREALLAGICSLPTATSGAVAGGSASMGHPGSPQSPLLQAKAHRAKLLKDLERAVTHSASLQSKLKGATHQVDLAEDEIRRIRGTLTQLDSQIESPQSSKAHLYGEDSSPGLDRLGAIPWHPNSAHFEQTRLKNEATAGRAPNDSEGDTQHKQQTSGSRTSFLQRVSLDLKERTLRKQELRKVLDSPEQKFQDPSYSAKRRKADFLAVEAHIKACLGIDLSEVLAGRADLTDSKPGEEREEPVGAEGNTEGSAPTLGEALTFLAANMAEKLGITAQQAAAIGRAKTEEQQLQRFADAVKESRFLQRYSEEVQSRQKRKTDLKKRWHAVEMQQPKPPEGRQSRFWKPQVSQEQRDSMYLESSRLLFSQAGWPATDFTSEDSCGADKRLDAVLGRALAHQTAAAQKAPPGKSGEQPIFEDDLDELQNRFAEEAEAARAELQTVTSAEQLEKELSTSSQFPSDLLNASMRSSIVEKKKSIMLGATMHNLFSTNDGGLGTLEQLEAKAALEEKLRYAMRQALPQGTAPRDVLTVISRQLGKCSREELDNMKRLKGAKKQLAVYRALVMQRFLYDIDVDSAKRAEKAEAALKQLEHQHKKLSAEEASAFFARLQSDADRRLRARESAVQAANDQQAAKLLAARKQLTDQLHLSRDKLGQTPGAGRPQSAGGTRGTAQAKQARPRSAGPSR